MEDKLFAKEQECDSLTRRAERAEAQLDSLSQSSSASKAQCAKLEAALGKHAGARPGAGIWNCLIT